MNRKYWIIFLVICGLIFSFPGLLAAAEPELDYLEFQTEKDNNLLIGETVDIKVILFDEDDELFSGSTHAYIADPDGDILGYYSIGGGGGYYTVYGVTLDREGEYSLHIRDSEWNYASGKITVRKPLLSLSGQLAEDRKTEIKAKLMDADGKVLPRKSVTVDGSDAGLEGRQSYTSSYDGTFSFWITPPEQGKVKFLYYGHEIGALEVGPSYAQGTRIGGTAKNNTELSLAVAREGWDTAHTVILIRDDSLADALTSVPLSRRYNAPVLMTPSQNLPQSLQAEIGRLEAERVIIIGGKEAVSPNIASLLQNLGYIVERIAGADRYDTAARITARFDSASTVYLAYGQGEADALAASSFAARKGIPILLTEKNTVPKATQEQLRRLDPLQVILLGGEGVIGSSVENSLKKNYLVERWGGADRYETAWAILRNLFEGESMAYFSSALVSPKDVAGGKPYGDALLAATLAAKNKAVVINLPPNHLPGALEYFLTFNKGYIAEARVIGNQTAISPILEKQLEQMLTR